MTGRWLTELLLTGRRLTDRLLYLSSRLVCGLLVVRLRSRRLLGDSGVSVLLARQLPHLLVARLLLAWLLSGQLLAEWLLLAWLLSRLLTWLLPLLLTWLLPLLPWLLPTLFRGLLFCRGVAVLG